MPVQVLDPVIGSAAIRTVASDGPNKSRILTAVLAFVLGFLGFHHFYLGNRRLGLIYLVFFWTNIPLWVSWLEGLSCLLMGKDTWQYRRYGVLVTWKGVLASVVVFALLGIIASFG